MVICKFHGQSLKEVGIDLRDEYFLRCSKVGSTKGLHYWRQQEETNLVYKEVLCWHSL
jgi:hypothetical protein